MTQVYLYQSYWLTPENNFKVDSLQTYLGTCPTLNIGSNFQYQKIALEMTIKIDMSQTSLDSRYGGFSYNYASIRNDSTTYYFFIRKVEWIAQKTIRLSLLMDVVNSLKYTFSDKTMIMRQHEDTLTNFEEVTSSNEIRARRVINRVPEKIDTNLYKAQREHEALLVSRAGEAVIRQNWYLIYRSPEFPDSNIPNRAFEVFICPEEAIKINTGQAASSVIYSNSRLTRGMGYYIKGTGSEKVKFSYSGSQTFEETLSDGDYVFFRQSGDFLYVATYLNGTYKNDYGDVQTVEVVVAEFIYWAPLPELEPNAVSYLDRKSYINAGTAQIVTLNGIENIDRTDQKLVKIIELPYQPLELSKIVGQDYYTFDTSKFLYDRDYNLIKANAASVQFIKEFQTADGATSELIAQAGKLAFTNTQRRNDAFYESKIYHSDYYLPKYYYDSFSYPIPLEKLSLTQNAYTITFDFMASNTINSRFLFYFKSLDFAYRIDQDYMEYLIISRNNEIGLFNSEYLNYIRNGYNYDVKAKRRDDNARWFRTGLNLLGGIAGFVAAPLTGGLSLGASISAIGNIASTIGAQEASDDSMEARLSKLAKQSSSVSGSDDVDLMNFYAKNRLLYTVYAVDDHTKKTLLDLFYYTGYAKNEMGIPNESSRTLFNFVQCSPVFKEDKTLLEDEYRQRLIACYQSGVTSIHNFKGSWNFEQNGHNRSVEMQEWLEDL